MYRVRLPLSVRWLATLGATFAAVTVVAWLSAPSIRGLLSSNAARSLDLAAWHQARMQATPAVLWIADFSNAVHGTAGILLLTALVAWVWHDGRRPLACLRLLVAVPGGMLLNAVMKTIIDRARPSWAAIDLPLSTSFPSGHVAEATVFYGVLAIDAARRETHRLRQALRVAAAVGMVAIVAFSRIVMGVHFLTDCLGALSEAGVWLAACFSGPPLRPDESTSGSR
jgi:membrane-associated phospholipid phosphatase